MILGSIPSRLDLPIAFLSRIIPLFFLRAALGSARSSFSRAAAAGRGGVHIFGDLVVGFPSAAPLDLFFTPAVGFAAGTVFYLSSLWKTKPSDVHAVVGEWVLITSPTAFNRTVLLGCPSVSFEDGGDLDGVDEGILSDERHYVNLNRGKISLAREETEEGVENISYQRLCVEADDGAEGSMDRYVRSFVFDALKHGYFPIVMNLRGSAGSSLTTPR
ncbi:hypothetical protein Cni_G05075 [Canna indica]|uniref:Uncharacterized protein n=1 Tax=Canna indica TaxID=4628 RepID=A0AAQ3Q3D8_9LILI|nr:hypothetical protein Cni_G05075 [Canna indica]